MEFTEAHAYYYVLRNRSRKKIVDDLNAVANASGIARYIRGLTLSSITRDATDYARLEWVKYYGPDTHQGFAHFSWERLHHKYRNRPSMFDLAIWQTIDEKQVLQALALGQPSNRKTQLNLNWIERSFARIKQVGPTTSLVETLAQQGWNWDDSDANIVVSDSSETDAPCLDDDEEVYHAA